MSWRGFLRNLAKTSFTKSDIHGGRKILVSAPICMVGYMHLAELDLMHFILHRKKELSYQRSNDHVSPIQKIGVSFNSARSGRNKSIMNSFARLCFSEILPQSVQNRLERPNAHCIGEQTALTRKA
jgi:hypothetical protein